MKRFLNFLLLAILSVASLSAQVRYYARAVGGNDANSGLSYAAAKATVAGVKSAISTRIQSTGVPKGGIDVLLEGEFSITSTLAFGPNDSGT